MMVMKRGDFVRMSAAGIGGAAVGISALAPTRGDAADDLVIGMTNPLTGTYAALGQNQARGAEFAVAAWNARGGVLGRRIVLAAEDDAADPGVAVQKARKLIEQDHAAALIGTVSSATTLSESATANTLGKVFIDMGGAADTMSGKDCNWNSFRTCKTAYMLTHATGSAFSKFGKRWYMISPDYAYGHGLAAGYTEVAKKLGATIVGRDLTPLGTADFSSYLSKVRSANPDVLIVNVSGNDFVNCMKQANSFGMLKSMAVGGPLIELESLWALPPAARGGYWGVEWYYASKNVTGNRKSAADFISAYKKAHNEPPTARSVFGYTAADRLLAAIGEAKSVDSVKVARALSGSRFQSPLWTGSAHIRPEDHQMMWPMWVGKVRAAAPAGDAHDLLEDLVTVAADRIAVPVANVKATCSMTFPA
jgi:branched-chain amino acid transport system substrate-binding protein